MAAVDPRAIGVDPILWPDIAHNAEIKLNLRATGKTTVGGNP